MICRLCGKPIPRGMGVKAPIGKTTWTETGRVEWSFGIAHGVCKSMGRLNREHRRWLHSKLTPLEKKAKRKRKGRKKRRRK